MVVLFGLCWGTANAANVAFFNDPAFVDVGQEGANLRATLVTNGHTVTDIATATLAHSLQA